ncbi:Ig-like domain-containing protein [bacterium]|nr:Ig-like domain-containing protein [bacterium]
MAYSRAVDERYNGGFLPYATGTFDAPSILNEAAVLADGSTGYGFLTDAYTLGDIDIYSLGILDAGYYSVDVDGYTWDDAEFGSGSVSKFQVLNSYGGVVDTSYSTYSNIDFTVTASSTYYVKIEGTSYGTEQYRVKYTKTGDLQNANSPAVFSGASITGDFVVGGTLTANVTYFDANGVLNATPLTFWLADGEAIASGANTYTLIEGDAGKIITAWVGFYDDAANLEYSGIFGPNTVVADSNSSPTGSILLSGTTKDGNTLTADTTNLDDADGLGTLSYQWYRNETAINGAKSNFYELVQDDIGSQITVIVSYTDLMGAAETFASNPTNVIFSSTNSVLNGVEVSLTGDSIIDGLTNGYKWDLDSSRVVDWTISSGFNGEFWTSPQEVVDKAALALELFSHYADVAFNYLGSFATPVDAAANGSEINFSMDGSGLFFNNDAFWAIGYFPEPDATARGDIYLNLNSQANYLASYEIGSAGFFLILHELGHTLGLKHPHDDGGNARPTFNELDLGGMDNDFMTIMSYEDGYDWNLINWDPGTPMFLDVLALQYLYGKSETLFADDSEFSLVKNDLYATIWDPSGNDLIDQSAATEGWYVVMPDFEPSTVLDTKVGLAIPADELSFQTPLNLYWLMGDFENINGSEFVDTIYGNSFENLIKGNGGDDILAGGSGSDTFIYVKGDGNDTILDFDQNEDSISYQGFNADEVAAFTESYLDDGSKVILLTDGAEITLNGNFSLPINNLPVLTIPATLSTDEDTATAAIAFSGSDVDGDDLTFSFSNPAKGSVVDNGNGTFTYTPDANANGSDSFRLTANDGTFDVTETVNVVVAAKNDLPTGAVTISGTAKQGELLTAVVSTLADADGLGTLAYQWSTGGVAISGATTSTLTLGQSQVGKAITVAVSYTDGGGTVETITSTVTSAVVNDNYAPTGSLTISGTAIVGNTLTVVTSTISDGNGRGDFSYQWLQDGIEIDGATAGTFLVTQDKVGGDLSVAANYIDGAGNFESLTSLTIDNVGIAFDPDLTATFTIPVLHFINNDSTGEDVVQFIANSSAQLELFDRPAFDYSSTEYGGMEINGDLSSIRLTYGDETFAFDGSKFSFYGSANPYPGQGEYPSDFDIGRLESNDYYYDIGSFSFGRNDMDIEKEGLLILLGSDDPDYADGVASAITDQASFDEFLLSLKDLEGPPIPADVSYGPGQAGLLSTLIQDYDDEPRSGDLDISIVSKDGDVVTFGVFANSSSDPDEDGISSFDFTISHDVSDMQIVASSFVFATGMSGVPNYDADNGTLSAVAFTLNNVDYLAAPLLTFEATVLDTNAPISIQIADIVVDGVDLANTTEVFDFSALAITTTITDRFGDALSSAEAHAYEDTVNEITATSTTDNVTVFDTASGSDVLIDAVLAIDTASDRAIGAFDALQALRLAVGLDKSDGTSEWHDYIAADINKDGRVGADDALNILKFAVGLTDGPSADWVFVDGDADYSAIDRRNTDYDEGILISDVMTDLSINMTGILVGDVDGSYIA